MKATCIWAFAPLTILAAATLSHANPPYAPAPWPPPPANYSPVFLVPVGVAPDALGPGFLYIRADGTPLYPNYCVYPPFPPFNGILPGMIGQSVDAGRGNLHAPYELTNNRGGQGNAGPSHGGPLPPGQPLAPQPLTQLLMQQPPAQGLQQPVYPVNPFVRGPRDFFMWREVMEDRLSKELRPALNP